MKAMAGDFHFNVIPRQINYCLNTLTHTSHQSVPEQKRQWLGCLFFFCFFNTASLPPSLLAFHCQTEGLSFHASPWDFSNSLNIWISLKFTAGKIFALLSGFCNSAKRQSFKSSLQPATSLHTSSLPVSFCVGTTD